MSIRGIGPLLAIAGAGAAIAVIVVERLTGFKLPLPSPWREWGFFVGIAMMIVGGVFWISSGVLVKRAFGAHHLVTSGIFRVSRNPMYAGFILFLIPGLALILNDIMLIIISVVMFVAFKAGIDREESFLAKEFGEEYERYRRSVPQLVPFVHV